MPTAEQKTAFALREMQRNPQRVLDTVVANTNGTQRNAILNTLATMNAAEELAQLEAFLPKYVGGDATLFAALEARIATLKGA